MRSSTSSPRPASGSSYATTRHRDDARVQGALDSVGTLAVGDDFDRAAGGSAERVEPRETAEDVLVYTSGTTALPKGVVYTRATQVTSVFVPQMAVGYDPSDRFLLFTPLAHRAAQPLLLCALFMGATTRLLTEYSPAALVSAIRDRGVTALVAVPTALKDILGLRRAEELGPMPGVRHVFLSGESVGSHLLAGGRLLVPERALQLRVREHRGGTRDVPRSRGSARAHALVRPRAAGGRDSPRGR